MPVLLVRLAGPMQSWGTGSRFGVRETEREPSKSGVLGLVCAALGVSREDDETLARFAAMPMGVRVNREGAWASDFQTVGNGRIGGAGTLACPYGVARADGAGGAVILSRRDYLADADFLVGLESEEKGSLQQLDAALKTPLWPLYLGRRSYVPGVCPAAGIVTGTLRGALAAAPYPPLAAPPAEGLRLILEAPSGEGETRYDVPLSFSHTRRRFRRRTVQVSILAPEAVGRLA
jgi:CRISPR system Cascade subunit CasD